jgi:glycerophosphoryl diester phosphodiesterase
MGELLKLAPEWPRGLLIENLDGNWEYHAKRLQCYSLNPAVSCLNTIDDVKKITNTGLKALPYTINQIDIANRLLTFGATSIITDNLEIMDNQSLHQITK